MKVINKLGISDVEEYQLKRKRGGDAGLTEEELKCCPFCGSDEVIVCRTNPYACWIRCSECGADAEHGETRIEAFANWNRRIKGDQKYAKIVEDDEAVECEEEAPNLPESALAEERMERVLI